MPLVSVNLSGLGVAPAAVVAAYPVVTSIYTKLFGRTPPEKPFPWRWDKPGREVGFTGLPNLNPGHFGIVYGTQHKWFRVWEGSVNEVFGRPGFDIGGTIDDDRRAWRAFVSDGQIQLIEDFGRGWVPVFSGTEQQMIDWTGHIGPIVRPEPALVTQPGFVPQPGFVAAPDPLAVVGAALGDGTLPLLLAAAVALVFILKR